ncbi:MAG: peptidase M28, partial [Rhodothermia bacterium]
MRSILAIILVAISALTASSVFAQGPQLPDDARANGAQHLIGAMLGDTPMFDDLHQLTDEIGGRVTGSEMNREAVSWAVDKFREAGVAVTAEDFEMPYQWQENAVEASVSGDVSFAVGVVAKPFSVGADELKAPLRDAGAGSEADFERLGSAVEGAWILIETPVLDDDIGLAGLFAEYSDAAQIEPLAFAGGAVGIVFMSSRP